MKPTWEALQGFFSTASTRQEREGLALLLDEAAYRAYEESLRIADTPRQQLQMLRDLGIQPTHIMQALSLRLGTKND